MKTKSALSYFGSDSEVASELAAMLDHCKHVTIPFCGGLSILPHMKARAIVANDLHSHAVTFYRVLSGRHGEAMQRSLIDRCQKTLSHPAEMEDAAYLLSRDNTHATQLDRAWAFWAQCWISRKGKGGTNNQRRSGLPSVRRTANGGTNATRIRAAADDLPAWAKQFERCEWESVCFRELLPKVADNPRCGIYCDPPWIGAGRDYLHTFDEKDHRDLRALLERFKETTVVVRYGDDGWIRAMYDGWTVIDAESRTQANTPVGEIWLVKNVA